MACRVDGSTRPARPPVSAAEAVHGYNALEGTFLDGCLLTGHQASRAAAQAVGSRLVRPDKSEVVSLLGQVLLDPPDDRFGESRSPPQPVITFVVLPPELDEVPEAVRAAVEQNRRIGKWGAYPGIPTLYAMVGLTAPIRPEPAPLLLLLYSVVAGSMPIALLPIRRRMHRHYFAQLQTPGAKSPWTASRPPGSTASLAL